MRENDHEKKSHDEEEVLDEQKEELDDALDPELIEDIDRDRGGFFPPPPPTL